MFCNKCGKLLPDGAKFCTGCGNPIDDNSGVDLNSASAGQNNIEPQAPGKREFKWEEKHTYMAIAGVVLLAAIIGICIRFARNQGSQQSLAVANQPSSVVTQPSSVISQPSSAVSQQSASESSRPSTSASISSTPESVIDGYIQHFDLAMNTKSVEPIAEYMRYNSPIYKSQSTYVKRENIISIHLDSYEIIDVDMLNDATCIITTRESYYVQLKGKPREFMTEESKFRLEKTAGKWEMTEWADEVKVLNRVNR